MDFILAKDIKVNMMVVFNNYNFMKLTEDNLFGCYFGGSQLFDCDSSKHGCNVWRDSELRKRLSEGGWVHDKIISEELTWNIENVTICTKDRKQSIETKEQFFIPSAEDMDKEWMKSAEVLLPRWAPSKIWLRDRKGDTQVAYWDKKEHKVKWTHPNTGKNLFLLCKIKPNTKFELERENLYIGKMIPTEENMPGMNYLEFESFLK